MSFRHLAKVYVGLYFGDISLFFQGRMSLADDDGDGDDADDDMSFHWSLSYRIFLHYFCHISFIFVLGQNKF